MACILREQTVHTANPKPGPGNRKIGIDAAQAEEGSLGKGEVLVWPQGKELLHWHCVG